KFEPTEAAVKGLSKHIRETLRAFPIADLAKMILKGRDRYQVRFEADEKGPQLFQCKDDGSVWLTREEAISHLLSEGALEKFYDVDEVDIGAPSGNFAQIAVCGMSGTLLGPPNHHEYQRNVMRLHAEKFSNMSLERFKSCIEMQSDEEVIEKWKESVSKQKQYRLKSDKPAEEEKVGPVSAEEPVAEEAAPSEEEKVERDEVADDAETDEISAENEESTEAETPEEEAAEEDAADETPVEESEPVEVEQLAEDVLVLKSPEELARHFKVHFADEAIEETKAAVVPGDIPGRSLSQGLLEHLKRESESLRRGFPLPMVQALCSALEREGLRFFKRGKKALHVSAVRPRPIKGGVSFSNEIQAIVDYVLKHSGARVIDLLNELAEDFVKPEKSAPTEALELTDGARRVLKDLRWLTSEGYLIELPDTRVVMGKAPDLEGGNAPSKKKTARKKTAVKKKSAPSKKAEAPKEPENAEEQLADDLPVKEGEKSGDVANAETSVSEPEPERPE
ncbi:hypothetical protein N9L71_09465, partial [Verrucomicrobiales bacterium]|nr:hypothetical protein [Verrucomicrobiales bacterium]